MSEYTSSQDRGFALFELIAVLTILVLITTFAIPRIASLETEMRSDSVRAFAGRVRSAAVISHALWLAQGQPATIEVHAAEIRLVNGYPDLSTIDDTLPNLGEFVYDPATGIFAEGSVMARCSVRYEEARTVGSVPIVTADVTDC